MTDTESDANKEYLRLWLKLLKVTRQSEAVLRDHLRRDFATTLPRFDVLAALDRFPDGLRMSELSRELRVSNGNVTGIIDRLVDEGLVERSQVPGDRRAFRVGLTSEGRVIFETQAAAHAAWVEDLMGHMGPNKAREMNALLDELTLPEEEGQAQKP